MHGRIAALFLLLALPAAAQAGPDGYIVRCTKGKQVSIQNVPCEPGWVEVESQRYYAPRTSRRALYERQRIRAEMDARNAAMRAPSSSQNPAHRPYDAKDCQNARSYRDRVRLEIGSQRLTRAKEIELCRIEERMCGWCRW